MILRTWEPGTLRLYEPFSPRLLTRLIRIPPDIPCCPVFGLLRLRASLVIVCPFLIQAFSSALASLFPIIVNLGLILGFTELFSSGFYGFASLLLQRSGERVSNICWVCVPFVVGLAQDSEGSCTDSF